MSSKAGDKDGNWSFLQKLGVRPSDGEPEFNECLMKVFRQKTQRKRQDHACKVRSYFLNHLIPLHFTLICVALISFSLEDHKHEITFKLAISHVVSYRSVPSLLSARNQSDLCAESNEFLL